LIPLLQGLAFPSPYSFDPIKNEGVERKFCHAAFQWTWEGNWGGKGGKEEMARRKGAKKTTPSGETFLGGERPKTQGKIRLGGKLEGGEGGSRRLGGGNRRYIVSKTTHRPRGGKADFSKG